IQSINFLLSKKNKVIVAACGTVSTVLCDLPRYKHIIGVVEPSCIAASKVTKNNNVGVIATPSAIESKKYQENIKKIDPNIKVISKSCPLLAPLIESRFVNKNDQILKDVLKFYIEPMLEENIDTLILGCTHYPIVKDTISEIAKNITIVDSGSETANFLFNYLRLKKLNNNERKQKLKIFVSDLSQNFVDNANFFLGKDVSKDVIKTKI
ncbi:MAG: aspartate/glutamate racemase family protein, partial [Firmicutes bacterium]|nr:aspartate/glutamate racemase family protein [Bacillota bacterium]